LIRDFFLLQIFFNWYIKDTNVRLQKRLKKCEDERKMLRGREMVGTVTKKTALKDLPKSLKQHVWTMNNVMRHEIVMSLKFRREVGPVQ
jgi:hypothetical protein